MIGLVCDLTSIIHPGVLPLSEISPQSEPNPRNTLISSTASIESTRE